MECVFKYYEVIMLQNGLYKAIRYFGSQQALAEAVGVTQQTVSHWVNRTSGIPYRQVLKIVFVTHGYVTAQELAPQEEMMNKIVDELFQNSGNLLLPELSQNSHITPNSLIKQQHKIDADFSLREGFDEYDILLGLNNEAIIGALENLKAIDFCSYDSKAEYIWIHEMARHQIGEQLTQKDKRIKAVNDLFRSLPGLIFLKRKLREEAREVLEFLNQKTNRNYRPVEANLKLIIARLSTGVTVTQCRQVIAKKTRDT